MLSFLHEYLWEPLVDATKQMVLFPMVNLLSKAVTAAATKSVSNKLTTAIANTMMGPQAKDPMQLTDTTLDRLAHLQIHAKKSITGCTVENLVSASFRLLDVVWLNQPKTQIVASLMAKSYNLALTTPSNNFYQKEVLVGMSSHTAGIFLQEGVDSMLPQAAPYAGYVAYGIASGLTKVGLERTLCR